MNLKVMKTVVAGAAVLFVSILALVLTGVQRNREEARLAAEARATMRTFRDPLKGMPLPPVAPPANAPASPAAAPRRPDAEADAAMKRFQEELAAAAQVVATMPPSTSQPPAANSANSQLVSAQVVDTEADAYGMRWHVRVVNGTTRPVTVWVSVATRRQSGAVEPAATPVECELPGGGVLTKILHSTVSAERLRTAAGYEVVWSADGLDPILE